MGTTKTLQENYWPGAPEQSIRTLEADTRVLRFTVPKEAFDTLRPAVADYFYNDATQIVASVERRQADTPDNAAMLVTYVMLARKAALSNGYAETRRRPLYGTFRDIVEVFGIATSLTAAGIPARGAMLDGGTGLTTPRCREVELDDRVWPGLVSVRSIWVAARAF